jgi:hypothetical protein
MPPAAGQTAGTPPVIPAASSGAVRVVSPAPIS